jgi:hypothetical protein
VIRSRRGSARVTPARTAPADGAWYREKQVWSSGTAIARSRRTGGGCREGSPADGAAPARRAAGAPQGASVSAGISGMRPTVGRAVREQIPETWGL